MTPSVVASVQPMATKLAAKPANSESSPDDEEFIEVVGFPNYLVSTYGRVFSIRSNKFMKRQTINGNAPRIALSADGHVTSVPLSTTVLTGFGKKPNRPNAQPRYTDGDIHNCALSNLSWA